MEKRIDMTTLRPGFICYTRNGIRGEYVSEVKGMHQVRIKFKDGRKKTILVSSDGIENKGEVSIYDIVRIYRGRISGAPGIFELAKPGDIYFTRDENEAVYIGKIGRYHEIKYKSGEVLMLNNEGLLRNDMESEMDIVRKADMRRYKSGLNFAQMAINEVEYKLSGLRGEEAKTAALKVIEIATRILNETK